MSIAARSESAERTGADDSWLWAIICYVFAYNVGTVILDFADPTRDALVFPAFAVATFAKMASMTHRVPRSVMTNGVGFVLPLVTAVAVVVLTA